MEGTKLAIYFLALLGLSGQVNAAVSDSARGPYQGIVERNIFGLRSPPAQPTTTPPIQTPAAPKVILTGITTILGAPLALLKVQFPAIPGRPANEQSYILTEGQKEGDIEVLKINDQAGTVQVNDFGTVMTLDINKDSPKPPATSPQPIPQQAAVANPTNPAPGPALPAPVAPPALPDAANTGLKPVPARVPRTGAPAQPVPPPLPPVQPQQLTPEEQALLLELERQKAVPNRGR